ncbi:MAG: M28 family peptidase [Verrucomicrobiota bacterium]
MLQPNRRQTHLGNFVVVRRRVLFFLMALFCLSSLGCGKDRTASRQSSDDPGKPWQEFSGEKALGHVQKLVALGPRPPGTEAIEKARAYIVETLTTYGWHVERQTFTDDTPCGKVSFVNLIADFAAAKSEASIQSKFLLCSHYDTKTFETIRFVGANDGGSSTGALMEMARVLSLHPELAAKIELVFFDGEEAYESFTDTDGLYGSRYFAKKLADEKHVGAFRGGILWDMIGDRDLTITLPPDSPAELARGIFDSATALNQRSHFSYFANGITDDHTPLNAAGVTTIDLIDFDFEWWHTAGDTIDKISSESLQTVGAVTAYYLSEVAFK